MSPRIHAVIVVFAAIIALAVMVGLRQATQPTAPQTKQVVSAKVETPASARQRLLEALSPK